MFKITRKQMNSIEENQKENFVDLMVDFVKNNFPEKKDYPELRKYVSDIIDKAEKYGYQLETDYEFFIDLHCSFPEMNTIPMPPKLAKILSWPDQEPEETNEQLFNALKFNYYAAKS